MAGEGAPNARVFISYRRADSINVAGRIRDRLARDLGEQNVFFDVDSIALGTDFRDAITETLSRVDAVLVVIGEQWLETLVTHRGQDFVRVEVELALKGPTQVIPVLIENTPMPAETQLPDTIRQLAFRNAARVRHDPDFHTDMDRLVRSLTTRSQQAPAPGITDPVAPPSTGATAPRPSTDAVPTDPKLAYLDIGDLGTLTTTRAAMELWLPIEMMGDEKEQVIERIVSGETVRVFYKRRSHAARAYKAMRNSGVNVTPSRNL